MTRALVLLAAYNGGAWIENQVATILAQEEVEVRLVIGDDASRDDTRDLIVSRFGNDERVCLLAWSEPSGSAGANFLRLMRTVDVSGFDLVALSDQDDSWLPGKLAAAATALLAHSAAGYSAAVRARWEDGSESVLTQCPRTRRADFLFEGAGQGCTFVLTRTFFERVQRFLSEAKVDMHFHDWMLYLLSRAWGERWVFDQAPWMEYRQHAGNDIGARGGSNGFMRRLEKIRDGWYADQIAKAVDVYRAAGGSDRQVVSLAQALRKRPDRTTLANWALAWTLLRMGRRRVADRIVLVAAVLARWI